MENSPRQRSLESSFQPSDPEKRVALIRPATAAEDDLHRAAAELGRPVARGWLSPAVAYICNLNAALRAQRDGTLKYEPIAFARGMCLSTRFAFRRISEGRDRAAEMIRRAVPPLVAARLPSNRIRAEAHAINGDRAFPLTGAEVEEIAVIEALRAARKLRRG